MGMPVLWVTVCEAPGRDLDLVDREPVSDERLEVWGLGGLETDRKGCANLARALAARFEYL